MQIGRPKCSSRQQNPSSSRPGTWDRQGRSGNRRSWVVSLSPWADNPGSSEKHLNRLNSNSEWLELLGVSLARQSAACSFELGSPLFTGAYNSWSVLRILRLRAEVGAWVAPCQFDVDELGCRSYASNVYPGWKIINFLWLFNKVISY